MVCKIEKSYLGYDQTKSLGHIISEFGRSLDSELVSKLLDIAPPNQITGVRVFLCLLNFNHEYIRNMNSIIGLIQDIIRKSDLSTVQR